MPFRALIPVTLCALALAAPGCVGYRPLCASAPAVEAGIPTLRMDGLPFEDAVALLVEKNPELVALRAEAAAVNLKPGAEPLLFSTELRDGKFSDTTIGTDVLSLFGVGKTGAERALARALLHEAWARHHERARELVGLLAEAYATDRVLRHVTSPLTDQKRADAAMAQLSKKEMAAAKANVERAGAEVRVAGLLLEDARREIANLLGASTTSTIVPLEPPAAWPPTEFPDERDLLFARGDLQRLFAEYVRADHELRLAVAEQIPGVSLHLGADIDLRDPLQILEISLPLSAPAKARAAHCAREAAYRKFAAGVHAALHGAEHARSELRTASTRLEAREKVRTAAGELFAGALDRVLATDLPAIEVALTAEQMVEAAEEWREAAVEAALARVRAAVAAGWPGPAVVGGCR